nr:hypothetical protein [Tanacetum cinerariifolium]
DVTGGAEVAMVVPCTGSSEAYIANNDTPTSKGICDALFHHASYRVFSNFGRFSIFLLADKNGSSAESLVLYLTPISSMKSAQSGFLNVRLFMTRLLCTYLFSIVTEYLPWKTVTCKRVMYMECDPFPGTGICDALFHHASYRVFSNFGRFSIFLLADKNGSSAESLVLYLTPISSMKSAQSGFLNVRLFMTRLLCTYLFSIVTEYLPW